MSKLLALSLAFGVALSVAVAQAGDPPAVGDKAADFTLTTVDGQSVHLEELNRQGPVVLVVLRGYPGYQCPICSLQVADLMKHAEPLKEKNAQVVLVYPGPVENLGEKAEEFIQGKTLPANFHYVTDPGYKFTNAYGLRWDAPRETAYPSTFVIDADGIVQYAKISKTHGGRAKASEVVAAVK